MGLPPGNFLAELEKEKQGIRLKKAELSEKRQFLISQRQEEYKQSQMTTETENDRIERERRDDLWREAVKHGSTTGEVNMSWQKLGDVSERVYNFRRTTTRDLIHLRLVGHELVHLPKEMADSCPMLESLTVTSNRLVEIDCVARLTRLKTLVAIRNKVRLSIPSHT